MNAQRIAVVSPQMTNRLKYSVLEFFDRRLGLQVCFFNPVDFQPSSEFLLSISYGHQTQTDWYIPASGLLEYGAREGPRLGQSTSELSKMLDGIQSGVFSNDWLAVVFWLLSRMEEYDTACTDLHGRYDINQSFLVKSGAERNPWIEDWASQVELFLKPKGFKFLSGKPGLELSFDIDHAALFRDKGVWRNSAGWIRDLFKLNWSACASRLEVGMGHKSDPYLNVAEIRRQLKDHPALFFFWLGDYGPHDKGLPYTSDSVKYWFSEANRLGGIGIHPSYSVLEQPGRLKVESGRFYDLTGKLPALSRFHYLRFRLPFSYRMLLQCGITGDYSMGFSDRLGFRAGTCMPFAWYDLEAEESTTLMIHPFAGMDSAAFFQMRLSADQYRNKIKELSLNTLNRGFPCHLIFHNEFPAWPGHWKNILELIIQDSAFS